MRVAVSGTHCCGKSTLIERFLIAHPDFAHEPEPYTVLEEQYGELFSAEPSADDFYRQLEFNIARLRSHAPGEMVIYERCPVDFLSYMLALDDLGRDGEAMRVADRVLDVVKDAIGLLDLIAFLPLDDMDGGVMSDSEDEELRAAVDARLVSILCDDELDLFASGRPAVLELRGATAERLLKLEAALDGLSGG
ncbi:MAG TPA: AAA family ATPase [Blastocatellia bacterium]|nr:AAA family ATPase [Blastocatellia bacterium]